MWLVYSQGQSVRVTAVESLRAAALSFSCTQGDHCLGISDTCYAALDFPIGTGSASKFNPSALHVAGIHTCLLSR